TQTHPLRSLVGVDGHLVQVLVVDNDRGRSRFSLAVQIDRLSRRRRLGLRLTPCCTGADEGQRAECEPPYCPDVAATGAASCHPEPTAGPPHGALRIADARRP